MLQQLLELPATLPGVMYGLDGYTDHISLPDYCPWAHATLLEARMVSNMTLPVQTPAVYSYELHTIFYRADLPEDVERCAIAHELVHFEHRDRGTAPRQEARANRVSTLRLIRPSRLAGVHADQADLPAVAYELGVTEKTMRLYARMARNGTLPK